MTVPQYLEDIILGDNRNNALARAEADQRYSRGNWTMVANLLSEWGDQAPTLPVSALVGLAHAGIGPTHPVGQQIVAQATPTVHTRTISEGPRAKPSWPFGLAPMGPHGVQGPEQPDVARLLLGEAEPAPEHHDRGLLGSITHGVGEAAGTVGHAASSGYEAVQRDVVAPVNRVFAHGTSSATGGAISESEAQAGFTPDPMETARTAFNAMNAPLQAIGMGSRIAGSMQPHIPGVPQFRPHGQVVYGSEAQMLDPRQISLYNQLKGQDTGTGFLPGGQAAATQAEASRAAGSIYGANGEVHGYTFGRGLANSVVTPGTRPYAIISGLTDMAVAVKGDPTAALLNEFSAQRALAHTFSATPEEAYASAAQHLVENVNTSEQVTRLRDWTAIGRDTEPDLRLAVIDKLKVDPGAASQLTHGPGALTSPRALLKAIGMNSLGASTYLRRHVNQPFALRYLNSTASEPLIEDLADSSSISHIVSRLGSGFPVGLASAIARTDDPDYVKFLIASEVGTTLAKPPNVGFSWLRPLEDVRMLHALPEAADITDRQQMFEQAERHLIAAHVPKDRWDAVLHPIADATDAASVKQAYIDGLGNTIARHLSEHYGVSSRHAKQLTRFFWDQSEEQSRYAVDQLGDTPHLPGVMVGGETVPIVGPHQTNELLNRVIPALDARKLTQASTRWRAALHLWDNQGRVGGGIEGFSHFLDFITSDIFKPAVLLAPRVMTRFLLDEQASMAADGMDSWLNHPIKMVGWTIGAKHEFPGMSRYGTTDLTGHEWSEMRNDWRNDYSQALGTGRTTLASPTSATTSRMLLKHYTLYGKDNPEYTRAWSEELSSLAANPVTRELARTVRDPNHALAGTDGTGIDAIKQAFWDGSLSGERKLLARADLDWGSKYLNPDVERGVDTSSARAFSDAYVESEMNRLLTKTAGAPERVADPDLIGAVADGTAFRAPGRVDREFMRALDDKIDEFGPVKVKGRMAAPKVRTQGWNRFVNYMFSKLMDAPTTTLTRSPAFRQEYYRKAQDLMPFMDQEGQALFLRFARENGVELRPVTQAGELAAEDADAMLKAHALEHVKKILYYPGERVGLTDRMRNIAPFADAWRRVIKRWSVLSTEHPQVIRRVQQGVTAARESGWFHPDPSQGGKEVFTMIPAALTGTGFPVVAPVQGLNIVGQGLPGVGPAVTMTVGPLLHDLHRPIADELSNYLFPYGPPDTSGGILETFFPGFADKLRTGGYLSPLGLDPSERQKQTIENLAKDLFAYKVTAGTVDMHDIDSIERGQKDARAEARRLYLIMGLTQFAAPAAPTLERNVKLKDGSVVERWVLTQDYRKILDGAGGDYAKANDTFIKKYGARYIFGIEPKAQTLVYGIGSGPLAAAFTRSHRAFANKFPEVYGYWAPTLAATQRGSYQDYLDQIAAGNLAPLSLEDWTRLSEARIGNVAYDQARKMIGPSPNAVQRQWLANVKDQLRDRFPGFDVPVGTQRLSNDQKIRQIGLAVDNQDVPAGDLTKAASAYLYARDQALAAAKDRGLRSLKSARMDDWKGWLFTAGTTIATRTPEFTNMWNDVFQYEVDPNG